MADFDPGTVLGQISEGLGRFADSVKVIGEPIQAAGKTIIPAVLSRVAFGAGGGAGSCPGGEEGTTPQGSGGGGGGFIQLTPIFLVVDEQGERLLTAPAGMVDAAAGIVDKVKGIVDQVAARRHPHSEEEAGE